MDNDIIIRPARLGDADCLAAILAEAFRHKYRFAFGTEKAASVAMLRDIYQHGLIAISQTAVLEVSGEIRGIAILRLPQSRPTAGNGSLWRILRRHLGVAKAIRAMAGTAFLHFVLEYRAPEESIAYLDTLAVIETARSQGVGTRLIEHCFDQARRAGCREIALHVVDTNDGARRLYERMGFAACPDHSVVGRIADMLSPLLAHRARFRYAHMMVKTL